MSRHCSTTTATGPMLPCQQDVAIIVRQEEDTEINSQPFNGMNFIFFDSKSKQCYLLCSLENKTAYIASIEARPHHYIGDWASCGLAFV